MASFEEKVEAFLDNYDKLKSVENEEAFLKQFMKLKAQSAQYREQNIYPADSGQMTVNRRKNRFKDIIPFEYTRVSLHAIEGVEGSDYVNANYVKGFDGSVTYIAAQGPLPHTVGDFWRMLWYHNIEIVLMACKLVEMAKPKCECYWPALNETKSYGPITVRTVHEEEIGKEFIIRDFVAECGGEKQQIRQYHYTSWPDHGRPNQPQPVLKMMDMMQEYRSRLDVPLLVHCSAGCGRTGTIIAIDIARAMILNRHISETLNPFNIVESMRKQRPAMVQAKEQYVFVFMAMAEMSAKALNSKTPEGEGEEKEGEDVPNYENCTANNTPLPVPRNNSAKNSSGKTKEEGESQPVPPARTNKPYENIPAPAPAPGSSGVQRNGGSDKRPPPPQPKPRSNGSSASSAESSPPRPTPPPKHLKPQLHPKEEPSEEHYSVVDMTQLRDKGPEIAVVSEEGRRAPLSKVEERMDKHGGAANTSRSIFETIMSEVGDLLSDEKESESSSPPAPLPPAPLHPAPLPPAPLHPAPLHPAPLPPAPLHPAPLPPAPLPPAPFHPAPFHHAPLPPVTSTISSSTAKWTEFEDEIPPPIPLHTEASTHIIETPPPSSDSKHVVIDSDIYYAPTPHSIPMPGGSSPPLTTSSPSRLPPPPTTPTITTSTSTTLPISSPSSSSSSSTNNTPASGKGSRLKIFKGIGKSKSEKRKPLTATDIGKPTGVPRSPSDHGLSSPTRGQSPSPDHGVPSLPQVNKNLLSDLGPAQAEPANHRFTFPGEMGFGLRIPRPRGPRPEPPHWNVMRNSITAI